MQVFLGFFGITRSLRHTAPSIRRNVIAPLRQAGLSPRCFGHFHLPRSIDNPRSGESGIAVDRDERGLLDWEASVLDPQEEALIEQEYQFCRTYPDRFADGYASVRNLCFQLRSLGRLWTLMCDHVRAGDWVLFLRPDLEYLDRLDLDAAAAVLDADGSGLGVPRWHRWGGLNDRLALCRATTAAAYATRGTYIYEATAVLDGLHGERLLAYAAAAERLRVGELGLRAIRLRANGLPAAQDVREFFAADGPDERPAGPIPVPPGPPRPVPGCGRACAGTAAGSAAAGNSRMSR